MKITVRHESTMERVCFAADADDDDSTVVEVPQELWEEFQRVDARREELLLLFDGMLRKARIDKETEIEQLRARLARLEGKRESPPRSTVIEVPTARPVREPPPPKPKRPEIDADGIVAAPSYEGTDAGTGGGSREAPMTYEAFNELLGTLRDRTTEKRARGGLG